jgi:hypothetical protein
MKALICSIFVVSLLLLRPYQLESSNLIYNGKPSDDLSYLSHATALALGHFPSYNDELFVGGRMPKHSIGPSILAAPFVFAFSRLDALAGAPVLHDRTEANVLLSWSAFGFDFATVFYFTLSCVLMFGLLRRFYSERAAALSTILLFVAQGFPLFAYRRPVFSHVYELFCQVVLILLLQRAGDTLQRKGGPARLGILGGVTAGLVTLVRYNNVVMSAAWPVIVWWQSLRRKVSQNSRRALVFLGSFAAAGLVMIAAFKLLPTMLHGAESYTVNREIHFDLLTPRYLIYRFLKLLFGIDWGLIWTAPFTLLGLGGLLASRGKKFEPLKLLLLPVLVNLFVVLLFASQGGWYGYRYLIFTLTPMCAFGLAGLIDKYWARKKLRYALFALALPPLLSMFAFEGNPTNLTLHIIPQDGREDWGNLTYQLEVWKTFFLHPLQFVQVMLKGVPTLLAVTVFGILGKSHALPAVLGEKYPNGAQALTIVRTLTLCAVPFAVWGLARIPKRRARTA